MPFGNFCVPVSHDSESACKIYYTETKAAELNFYHTFLLFLVWHVKISSVKIDLLTKYVRSPLVFLDSGYFMKFDTSSGNVGNSAMLESRILYPKRGEQCLQFFYKMTGAAGDKLVIWTRADDGTGNITSVKKIHSFTGILFCQSCDN